MKVSNFTVTLIKHNSQPFFAFFLHFCNSFKSNYIFGLYFQFARSKSEMVDHTDGKMSPILGRLKSKVFHRERSLRIVMLGSSGVGKTGKEACSFFN